MGCECSFHDQLLLSNPCHRSDNGAVTANDEQVIMAMLVGCGRGKSRIAHEKVAALIEKIRPRVAFAEDEREHRRGMFSVKAIGISHGGGQKVRGTLRGRLLMLMYMKEPGPLKHSDKTRRELMRIVNLKPMQQIAHVNSGKHATLSKRKRR